MNISLQNKTESSVSCDVLILLLTEGKGVRPYKDINTSVGGLLSRVVASREFEGRQNQVALLHTQKMIRPQRILLVGIGKAINREKLRQAGGSASRFLSSKGIRDVAISTRVMEKTKHMPTDFLEGFLLANYRFTRYKKEKNNWGFRNITILSEENLKRQIKQSETVASATLFARDLVNTPANDMTPSSLVRAARSLKKVSIKVFEKKEAEKLGMEAFLSVAKGSTEPPKFIVISYGKKNIRPVVLIGKSITFDSGGISLKPSQGMEKMKYDMAGGAAVLGVLKACSEMNLPLHVIGILPATENLPGGSASKPGDVVTAMEGKTIEIISTDAEGRMALADAIGYAKKLKPSAIIDIATLTGACVIALGGEAVAMMGNDEALMKTLHKASEDTNERVWKMPLFEEYGEYIKSDIADLKNSAGKGGALVTAGYFLKEFAGDTPWVHLDIAGIAWTEKDRPYIPQGATGVGVRLLLDFLMKR
ncbi:MAG: leucyl aminopeptidase [Nitrospiraceae bacterium]|nr:MAG: leucyl aminopeptidase [Nitrospiraceae bacterium]